MVTVTRHIRLVTRLQGESDSFAYSLAILQADLVQPDAVGEPLKINRQTILVVVSVRACDNQFI